jgi:molybdate transport system substrate-binding protein
MKTLAIVVSATLLAWPIAATAQVKVLMSGGFSGAYQQLLPEFERTSGIKVTTRSRWRAILGGLSSQARRQF